ncbi:hypothetical protein CHS0354_036003 [Potamilus streckersoni]|uniref:Uncharacterized protein n=1 Tax=Potamilus streckersoni TaxID=2493646 RepID=A0AAE0SFE5_9BIVA|nr:hypothetical protein CHS0354_036003 [Potamilus streckersoni]
MNMKAKLMKVTVASLQQNGQTVLDKTLTVTSGKPSTIYCITGNSRPAANIDWYIGFQKRGSETSLNFIPTNEDNDKAIYCQAYNIDPNQPVLSNKPILFVRAAPKILDVSLSYKGYAGQCIMIQFDFYSNTDENLTVTAQHSNSSGLINQGIIRPPRLDDVGDSQPVSDFRATLAICMKSETDFGQYDVEVKNIVGTDSKIIKIIKQITPEKPVNFHVTNIQKNKVSLKWLSEYNWGFAQVFVVEASIDNITWINVSQVNSGYRDGWFSTIVGDLIPGSEYFLRLYAYNINGRGDFADVQLKARMLKESTQASSMEVGSEVGIGVGGAVGVGVGGAGIGIIGAIIAFAIRRRLHGMYKGSVI